MFFVTCVAILAIGTPALLGYSFLLYRLGRSLARLDGLGISAIAGTILTAILALPIAALALVFPFDPVVQLGIAVSLYYLHAQPLCVGFWAGRETRRLEHERRWSKNADDWLGEWECREVSDRGGTTE